LWGGHAPPIRKKGEITWLRGGSCISSHNLRNIDYVQAQKKKGGEWENLGGRILNKFRVRGGVTYYQTCIDG